MEPETPEAAHTVAVFAAPIKGQEEGWEAMLAEAGRQCAVRKWRLIFLAENGNYCPGLIAAARAAGGEVLVLSDEAIPADTLPQGAVAETVSDAGERLQEASDLADGFLCLPTSLLSVRSLLNIWSRAGGGSSGKPVAFLNRNRAYEVMRGYAQDVLSQSLPMTDRLMMFSDNLDDLTAKLQRELDRLS